MFEKIASFWACVFVLGIIGAFGWLTWHLPECVRLVWYGIDDTAIVGIALWVVYAAIISIGTGYAYDLAIK